MAKKVVLFTICICFILISCNQTVNFEELNENSENLTAEEIAKQYLENNFLLDSIMSSRSSTTEIENEFYNVMEFILNGKKVLFSELTQKQKNQLLVLKLEKDKKSVVKLH